MQDALKTLSTYWSDLGCLTWQPFNGEVGAGTMNPATVLRVLGPEPWDVAYVEPSVRPDDPRYGENPNRLQTHTQFQVILKPEPGDAQERYLGSLEALGIDLGAHDVRFVEDNWAQPAIGAWGLGWEVWLDGMEITQFTYFQQVGGHNLDPVPVELTYGMERILMAVQGKTHFRDIVYAVASDGREVTYGEAFGQQEYEMSRYYLDDADVEANRRLYETYVAEAGRMVDVRLPVPAHSYILKSSHAFNVLDARGAISTTERAKAFGTMRRLMRETAALWIERREELGLPLLRAMPEVTLAPEPIDEASLPTTPQTFALEIGLEEMPAHVVPKSIEQVREIVAARMAASKLEHGILSVDGTPRRIVVSIPQVASREPDTDSLRKGPRWDAAFDADGKPTRALEGFIRGQGSGADAVIEANFGGISHAAIQSRQLGRGVLEVLADVVTEAVRGLHAEKNMRWCDPELSFSRAIRWIVALWGDSVVPVVVSSIAAGRVTYVHRADADPRPIVPTADDLAQILAARGIVPSVTERRAAVVAQAALLAAEVGGFVDFEGEVDLIDQIANLVEQPHGIRGSFEERYLELPERVLTTVMRKHQRYLPVRNADGSLLPTFITMANGECDDDIVRAGNESVLRARYDDALFFWNADLQTEQIDDFVPGLDKLTFEERLGSVGERARRIAGVASDLADRVGLDAEDRATLSRAGTVAKYDLATKLVVEMSSLAGFVAREYALRKGEPPAVADALFEMEAPHTAIAPVPSSAPGALLALGDRADLLIGMFALGAKPTGSSDPFGLRRAALGLARILRESAPEVLGSLSLREVLDAAAGRLANTGVTVPEGTVDEAQAFVIGRFEQLLRDENVPAGLVKAVLPGASVPGHVSTRLEEIAALKGLDSFRTLLAALVRTARIVPEGTTATLDAARLTEPAEAELVKLVRAMPDNVEGLGSFVSACNSLATAIHRFFDETLVMSTEPELRAARLGLLASVLAKAPSGVDWKALDTALDTGR